MNEGRDAVFALLDDAQAGQDRRSRLYTDFVDECLCPDPADLDAFWAGIDARLAAGQFAVLLADYEWGVALQRLPRRTGSGSVAAPAPRASGRLSTGHEDRAGCLRVLLFRQLRYLSAPEVDAWLMARQSDGASPASDAAAIPVAPAGTMDMRASVTPSTFESAISRIHAALRAGDCYQINYTYRLAFQVFGSPITLYRQLRARQLAPYGALIRTREDWVLSLSPELFIAHRQGEIVAKPMKGTAARDPDPTKDRLRADTLANDPKNRAENVMIVDLLRNDLGRLAAPGGVRVSTLFAVEGYPTVWQMTSTVEAALPAETGFPEVLRALFPCGSITGAPKRAAIDFIEALEGDRRGLYTGAIGWIDSVAHHAASGTSASASASAASAAAGAPTRRCGDFCLSVAIRTLTIEGVQRDGLAAARTGIGAGIVLDSRAADEYEECLLKARFLTEADPGFALFETILATPDGSVPYRRRHLDRLADAARRLGFTWRDGEACAAIDRALFDLLHARTVEGSAERSSLPAFPHHAPHRQAASAFRLRLSLSKDGTVQCTGAKLSPLSGSGGPVAVLLAHEHGMPIMRSDEPLRRFKTTARATYDAAWQTAERLGAFDMLFCNEKGHLTEGGRTNCFVKLDGQWVTPPLSDGLLPGVMRSVLLDDPTWRVTERSIAYADLCSAQALVLTNGLRGAVAAVLVHGRHRAAD